MVDSEGSLRLSVNAIDCVPKFAVIEAPVNVPNAMVPDPDTAFNGPKEGVVPPRKLKLAVPVMRAMLGAPMM